MHSLIHIGNEANKYKDSVSDAAAAIDTVFGSARTHVMDQATVIEALRTLSSVAEIKNITITNSTFVNDQPDSPEEDMAVKAESTTPFDSTRDDDDDEEAGLDYEDEVDDVKKSV
jgi:hypothetical protein